MSDSVDPQVAQVRHQRLINLAKKMSTTFNRIFIGQTVDVLVEGYKDGICSGGSEHYVSTSFQGSEKQKKTVVPVKILTASANGLIG